MQSNNDILTSNPNLGGIKKHNVKKVDVKIKDDKFC